MVPTDSTDDGGGAREQPGRYQRSASGMVGALLVTLLVIGGYVAFRAFNRTDLQVSPQRIDYLTQVAYAQQAGADVVYPARLPAGWYATQVSVTQGQPPGLVISMLTPAGDYVGYVESDAPLASLVTTYVDQHAAAGPPATVAGSVATHWSTWTDSGGDTALGALRGHGSAQQSLLVFGTVSESQLNQLAGSLTTATLP